MRRVAVPLVIVGSTGVLVMLVMLWRAISADSGPAPAPAQTPSSEPGAAPAPASGTTPSSQTGPLLPQIRPQVTEPSATGGGGGSPMPALQPESAPPGSKQNTKNLEWGLTQMRAQAAANEPKLVECLERAASSGDRPSGDATLTFIAARKGDAIVIEQTGVDHDHTTLTSEPLLECLHTTSKAMSFAGLPREANAVIITRTVKVENGGLVENKVTKFSYLN